MIFLLALALAAPAAAEVAIEEYRSPVVLSQGYGWDPVVSEDGYHFMLVDAGGESETLYLDAKKLAKGAPGDLSLTGSSARSNTGTGNKLFVGALSRDGKVAAHAAKVRDAEGRTGWRLAVNGSPVGKIQAEIREILVSPAGSNVAIVAKTSAGKYAVYSTEGEGPSVDEPERLGGVGDAGVVYKLTFSGKSYVYRDHKALPNSDFAEIAVSAGLAHIAGVTNWTPAAVIVDGKELGRWKGVQSLHYTPAGDLVFLARTGAQTGDGMIDTFVINGRETAVPPHKPLGYAPAARPGDGLSFFVDYDAVLHVGGRAMAEIGKIKLGAEWIGFSPSGRRWVVAVASARGFGVSLDGKEFAAASPPLRTARIIFDSETEFHYLADSHGRAALVCGAIDGEVSARSACARHGAVLGAKIEAR